MRWFNSKYLNSLTALLRSTTTTPVEPEPACPYMRFTFSALGYLSKAEGRVIQAHIDHIEELMLRLEFNFADRMSAIQWFNEGKLAHPQTNDRDLVHEQQRESQFLSVFYPLAMACQDKQKDVDLLQQITLECMCLCAWVSGLPSGTVHDALIRLTDILGINATEVTATESVVAVRHGLNPELPSMLVEACGLLGVSHDAPAESIKLAYRRQISKHHPDKYSGAAFDDCIRQLAEDNTRRLTQAYEFLSKRA